MQHAQPIPSPFPWRTATLVVGAIAALELVALIAFGVARLAPKRAAAPAARATHAASATHAARAIAPERVRHVAAAPTHSLRPRAKVRVLVLNGNGRSGAAAAEAQRLAAHGYRIGGAANAQRHDYARSMVLFVPGWAKEARRLGRDVGVRLVAPLDGLPRTQLRGSKIVLLLGT